MLNPNNLCPGCMNEKVTEGKCPICGYNPEEPVNPQYLAPGSMLDARYSIGKVLESNGEGVTYLGYDTVTAVTVNIREFFPSGLCERDSDGATVIMLSGNEYSYNASLTKFIELSRELFRLNELPALFDVLDVREANSTAYRITRAVPGISLREFLMRNGGVLKWDQARSLFAPLVSSISALHGAGIVHRGISPDTLIVGKDGKLRLNGFCIAEARTAKSPLTSQLFPGFAAVEQYGAAGTQGPWTDIYAFAATIYRTIVGNPPPEATDRLENDNMTIPAKIARETPKAALETLANALQVLPDDRTQAIDEMRRGLSVSSTQPTAVPVLDTHSANGRAATAGGAIGGYSNANNGSNGKKKKKHTGGMYGIVAGVVTAFLLTIVIIFVLWMLGIIGGNGSDSTDNSSNNGLSNIESFINNESVASKQEIVGTNKIELPNFISKQFTEASADPNYKDDIKFKVVSKQYSDEFPAGTIIEQNPKSGEAVAIGTTIEVVVSLGPSTLIMPNVVNNGFDSDAAKYYLVKQGFNYNNIKIEVRELPAELPGIIVQSDPEPGTRVSVDSIITLTLNSYAPTITEPDDTTNSTP